MTRDEAVAAIKFELRNRQDTALDAQIVLRLQQSQRLLEMGRSLPFFLKQEDATLTLPAGSADVAFPTGFLREVEDEAFHYTSDEDDRVYLEKVDQRNGDRTFFDTDAGRPRAYAIRKTGWKFYPERDVSYDLTYSFYKTATSLAANAADNAWLVNAPDILIGHAGARMAAILSDEKAKIYFQELFTAAWNGVFAETIMREEENKPLVMGSRNH